MSFLVNWTGSRIYASCNDKKQFQFFFFSTHEISIARSLTLCNYSIQFRWKLRVFEAIEEIHCIPCKWLQCVTNVKETFDIISECLSIECEKICGRKRLLYKNGKHQAIHSDVENVFIAILTQSHQSQKSKVLFQSSKRFHFRYIESD